MPFENADKFREEVQRELKSYCRYIFFKPKDYILANKILSALDQCVLSGMEIKGQSEISEWKSNLAIVESLFSYYKDEAKDPELIDTLMKLLAKEFDQVHAVNIIRNMQGNTEQEARSKVCELITEKYEIYTECPAKFLIKPAETEVKQELPGGEALRASLTQS